MTQKQLPQMLPGKDVFYTQNGSEHYPGKLIRQGEEGWNIILFTENGIRNVRNVPYSQSPNPNTFCLLEEAEHATGVGRG